MTDYHKGRVYRATGSRYQIKTSKGEYIDCYLRGKLRTKIIKSTSPVVVGDIVYYIVEHTGDTKVGVIVDIFERKNVLMRKSVNLSKQIHILAANIDCIYLIITLKEPLTTTTFIDRCLLMSEAFGMKSVLVFNKIDHCTSLEMNRLSALIDIYQSIGYQCIRTSAHQSIGLNNLREIMVQKTNIFYGHSGVGKSTLISAIQPSLKLKTKDLSKTHQQGQHTTTFAEMYDLDFGGQLIDTPGIKGFGIVQISPEEVANYFVEFFKIKNQCKYYDCRHVNEPNCAVKSSVALGKISSSRYRNYLQIIEEESSSYR